MTEDKAVDNLLADHYQAGRKKALQEVEKMIDEFDFVKFENSETGMDYNFVDELKQKLHSLEEKKQ